MGFFNRKMKQVFICPMGGNLMTLEQVSDPVFAEKLMGDGFAVELVTGEVFAPISGTVEALFPTGHAIGLKADNGMEVLIHIGIDTVELEGKGFEVCVKQGDQVKQGQLLIKVDVEYVKSQGKSVVSPVIFTTGQHIKVLKQGTAVAPQEEDVIKFI